MTKVQYGCGLCAPEGWHNFDASPTLRLQKIPVLNKLLPLNVRFPPDVKYGDIIKGLPQPPNSVDAIYCSHILEHLSLNDFRKALQNTYTLLKPGGVFRLVVPDIEAYVNTYLTAKKNGNPKACEEFIRQSLLGVEQRTRGLKGVAATIFGNAHHLWMWDYENMAYELKSAGFKNIRRAKFNENPLFIGVEEEGRFVDAVAIESEK